MRKVRSIVSLFLAMLIILCGVVSVSAAENEYDWANYDWENFSTTDVSAKEWGSMCKWLPTEADIKLLFDISMKVDGYRSEGMGDILFKRFRIEPVNLIMALSAEEEAVQEHVIGSIVHFGIFERAEFEQLLSGVTLPENAGADAMNILVQMVRRAEENWGMDITNPQTGDPIGLAALLMVASGLGTAVLLKRQKLPV